MAAIASSAIGLKPTSAQGADCPAWRASVGAGTLVLSLHGDWSVRGETATVYAPVQLLERTDVRTIGFDSSDLGTWDSSLLLFLSALRAAAARRRIDFEPAGLPTASQRLLLLLPADHLAVVPASARVGLAERIGEWTIRRCADVAALTTLFGAALLRAAASLQGKVKTRAGDFLSFVYGAGVSALPIVALVNVLVGAIVAFLGGIQLRRLGAEGYVGNLIGVTEVREMGPLITAIVMSGRTGSAYAAEIAAMQGSEEIDALRALGIPIFDYLVLPRLAAFTTMMPPLCTYAAALGIFGGCAVAVFMMNIAGGVVTVHLRAAVAGSDIFLGLAKSIAFGSWIAIAACHIGLRSGRSATDVGRAATTASVSGIVGVIALDAMFDLCAEALGI
jgi:phospholipid/cholesterol/gamma-HCH transport system permease protein